MSLRELRKGWFSFVLHCPKPVPLQVRTRLEFLGPYGEFDICNDVEMSHTLAVGPALSVVRGTLMSVHQCAPEFNL